jgi:predicted subunit of tRNA(5-methylaminomethyl-2-thiouridylate) methyltransferase
MKAGSIATRASLNLTDHAFATIAAQELQMRIHASGLADALVTMACDLCMEAMPLEEAFQKIQESAMEKMVRMLDTNVLADDSAMKSCLETVAVESERVAWQALEKGADVLSEGFAILDGLKSMDKNGMVN